MGMLPGGLHRNRDFRKNMVETAPGVPEYLNDILYDPQTSGGLLIAVAQKKAPRLLSMMHEEGIAEAAIIGEVVGGPPRVVLQTAMGGRRLITTPASDPLPRIC